MINFRNPKTICLKSEEKWRLSNSEVSLIDEEIYLQTDCASWVKIEWEADFSSHSLVLGDAWERTYGDVCWKPIFEPTFHPWYFSVKDGDVISCIGVKTGPSALCSWTVSERIVTLLMDVRCGCLDTQFEGRKIKLAELVSLTEQGDAFNIINKFCRKMCDKPALPKTAFYGGNDWYDCYGNNSYDSILSHSKLLSECSVGLKNRPYLTIDTGWQKFFNWYSEDYYIGGPFNECNVKFGDMKKLAEEIHAMDVKPGIWYRPLQTIEYMPDDAFLRRQNINQKILDPSHPMVIEKTQEDVQRFIDWGYELIKQDFTTYDVFGHYAPEMTQSVVEGDWSFYDRSKTSAEIFKEYYILMKNASKQALINACETFSHLSAGVFDIYRIGDDTSGLKHPITIKMGVNTVAVRGVQHNAFYSADPDCVAITDRITWEQSEQWLEFLKYSGLPLNVSVQKECYTKEVREAITEAFAIASEPHKVAEPIDWYDTKTPTRWLTFDGEKEFVWKY